MKIALISVSATVLALAAAFLVLGSVFYWGNVIIFGVRGRGGNLFLFTVAFLVPSVWCLAWLGCGEKKKMYSGSRKMIISAVFLIINGLAAALGLVELGFFIAMAVPGSYGPVYVLKEKGVQMHWRGGSGIESVTGQ